MARILDHTGTQINNNDAHIYIGTVVPADQKITIAMTAKIRIGNVNVY